VTTDHEKIRFCKILFHIHDSDLVRNNLTRLTAIDHDPHNDCWIWYKTTAKKTERTVLGTIKITKKTLTAETNSLERALRLKNKLNSGLGQAISYERIESTDMKAMPEPSEEEKRLFEQEQKKLHTDPEARKMILDQYAKYYLQDWISTPLPALENERPLDVAKTRDGRLKLEALINSMELRNDHMPDYMPAFDFNRLRKKLGLPIRNNDD
jgi:hypothetical protein